MLNVYNSLQSSFLSLAWLWPGRSLPKGNSGSAGTLDWGPMWLGSQSTCHLQCTPTPQWPITPSHPYIPYAPILLLAWVPTLPASPNAPLTPHTPLGAPDATYTPAGAWVLHSLLAPQCTPDGPNPPDSSLMPPDTPYTPRSPWCSYTPADPWSTYTPCQPPNAPLIPVMDPLMSPIPLGASQCPLMLLIPLLAPEHLHPDSPQCSSDTPTLPDGSPMPPDTPYIP